MTTGSTIARQQWPAAAPRNVPPRTIGHLSLFDVVPFDDTAVAEFGRLRQTKGLKNIGRADLLIAQRHRFSVFLRAFHELGSRTLTWGLAAWCRCVEK
jgi:hypothetical protein